MTDRKALTTALDEFYGAVAIQIERFQRERTEADLTLATNFSVFDYIEPDENRLSDIVRDLLDPFGKHGQGRLFLDLFLDAIGVNPELVHPFFQIKREDRTLYCASPERRIDITLDFGDFGIGIENKPFHYEAANQLMDYYRHLCGKYGQRFVLVYLSGDGSEPISIDKAELDLLRKENRFMNLAYRTGLYHWLEHCIRECKAEKVRLFLLDFAEYVNADSRFYLIDSDQEPSHEAD